MEWGEGEEASTTEVEFVVREKAAPGVLGAPIARAAIVNLTLLALYNLDGDGAVAANIINDRANVPFIVAGVDQDGLPPWSYGDTDGKFIFTLTPADMPLVDQRLRYERHVALFQIEHTGGAFPDDVGIYVKNRNGIG